MRDDSQLFFLSVNLATELHTGRQDQGRSRLSTAKRSPALPDVPTVAESGLPNYNYDAWFAVMAPAGTPKPILNKVSRGYRERAARCPTLPIG